MNKGFKAKFSFFLACLMLVTAVPLFAFAALAADTVKPIAQETAAKSEMIAESANAMFQFVNLSKKEVAIAGCVVSSGDTLTIPEKFGDYTIVKIATDAFKGDDISTVKTVNVPYTVREIATKAFNNCPNIATVEFKENSEGRSDLIKLDPDAFYNCTGLKGITIPKGVVEMGEHCVGFKCTVVGSAKEYEPIENFNITGYRNTAALLYVKGYENSIGTTDLYGKDATVYGVEGIKINPSTVALKEDEYSQLSIKFANVKDDEVDLKPTNKFVRWFSNNESVAVVDYKGVVSYVGPGTAKITAISSDNLKKDTIEVTCTGKPHVRKVEFTFVSDNVDMSIQKNYLVKYALTPTDAVNTKVKFAVQDPSILEIYLNPGDKQYYINPLKKGTTKVTIYAEDTTNGELKDEVTINVTDYIPVTKVMWTYTVDKDSNAMALTKGSDYAIKYAVYPENATDKSVELKSSDDNIAFFDQSTNKLYAIKSGTVKLTIISKDNPTLKHEIWAVVRDTPALTSIKLDADKLDLTYSTSHKFTVTYNPTDAANKNLVWTSSNPKAVTVDQEGNIKAVNTGSATITATSKENTFLKATCEVKVRVLWWQWIFILLRKLFGN
ncbi:MAG: Ig-like domain-containing protein [Clostridiales bacterium]|nr:Ig-like domain-containing protein [Clostridiales bacterium]